MKNKNRFAALLLALTMVFALLCACGSTKDVEVSEIVAALDAALNKGESLVAVGADYIKGYLKMDVSEYDGSTVKINAYGANIDEYGVFRAKDSSQARDIKSAVDDYLQLRVDSWMDEYMPEEKPKLSAAEVRTNGNYVMYCILGDADKSAAFAAFDDVLK